METELDDRFSDEAKMLARLAPKASMMAVRDASGHTGFRSPYLKARILSVSHQTAPRHSSRNWSH